MTPAPVEKYRLQLEHDMYYAMVGLLGAGSGHEFYKEMARPFVEIAEKGIAEAIVDIRNRLAEVVGVCKVDDSTADESRVTQPYMHACRRLGRIRNSGRRY